jgi:hypothetical protein
VPALDRLEARSLPAGGVTRPLSNRANGREVHHILVGRVEPYWFAYRPTHINTGTCRNRSALIVVTGMEAEMPLLFFLPMIIASGLLYAPRTAKPVREDD